ncbi:MAG: hypothetical protein NC328_06760 [Muribaculum sp.]|nr:hypothetical protein [Muribaculum sp.]
MFISDILTSVPEHFSTPTQKLIYEKMDQTGVSFRRVDNDPAISVDDCEEISRRLDAPTVKTLFVANRQLTKFYLVVMPGHKPFITRHFTGALGVSRVSFVKPEVLMEKLGLEVGSATPLAIAADKGTDPTAGGDGIMLVLDEDLRHRRRMLIPDGTSTCYLDIATSDLIDKYLPATDHTPVWAEMKPE